MYGDEVTRVTGYWYDPGRYGISLPHFNITLDRTMTAKSHLRLVNPSCLFVFKKLEHHQKHPKTLKKETADADRIHSSRINEAKHGSCLQKEMQP